jgi:hypothetical protein
MKAKKKEPELHPYFKDVIRKGIVMASVANCLLMLEVAEKEMAKMEGAKLVKTTVSCPLCKGTGKVEFRKMR